MGYSFPQLHSIPDSLIGELKRTTPEEWDHLIRGIVSAIDLGKGASTILEKVVEAGWTRDFATFCLTWAQDEIEVRNAESGGGSGSGGGGKSPVEGRAAWERFVKGIEPFRADGPGALERLLDVPIESRVWKPWEVVALDTAFRKRLAEALNAPTLSDLTDDLRSALALLQQAGITRGESKSQQSSFQPIFHESGAIQWFTGWRSQGATVDPFHEQVRVNTVGLGAFLDWYAFTDARRWLAGVDKVGPVDITALRDLLAKAEQNVAMGNDSVAVMANFRSEMEPHARVVAVRWLSDHLKISYHGPSPTAAMRCKIARGSWGGSWVLGGIVGGFCGIASEQFSLKIVLVLLGALGGLILTNLMFRPRSYWQHWG